MGGVIPIYSHPSPSHAVQAAMVSAWRYINIKEGHLDTKGHPLPVDGSCRYQDNTMTIVRHTADEGRVSWQDKSIHARSLAKELGYECTSNCMAAVRDAVINGLIGTCVDESRDAWLFMTEYGFETLERWERYQNEG